MASAGGDIAAAVTALTKACNEAFDDPAAKKSCSHAVWCVLKDRIDPDFKYRQANDLVRFLNNETSKWRPVDLETAHSLAYNGVVVVGGAAATSGSGHVIVVYPGTKIPRGGYNFVKNGKVQKVASKGLYPRALSTSIGSWPGAISDGEKTVWDPWGNDEAFKKVAFWTPQVLSTAKVAGKS